MNILMKYLSIQQFTQKKSLDLHLARGDMCAQEQTKLNIWLAKVKIPFRDSWKFLIG